jgi:pSer/pThr/pTyr-binding forkhead associated (FHA) protein
MPIIITVCTGDATAPDSPQSADLSLTFDMPRLIIGRGEGCDLRLPDPSVSHRHASIRQRGHEYVIVDEGSTNGTALDKVVLAPQSPRVLRSGERVRVGRVWLEVRIDPLAVARATPATAKALALSLVMQGLATQGEDAGPRIVVVEGPDKGKRIDLEDPARRYVIGRSRETDLPLDEPEASRRHVEVGRKGDHLLLRDLGSRAGSLLEGNAVGPNDAPWRVGQALRIGDDVLVFEYPAVAALAELERSPDEPMRPGEAPPPPPLADQAPGAAAAETEAAREEPAESPAPPLARGRERAPASTEGGWSLTDGLVLLFALGVLVLSVAGFFWLMRR